MSHALRRTLTALGLSLAWLVAPAAAGAQTAVIVAPVRSEAIHDRVEALGTLRAQESVELSVSVTEVVSAIHFEDGDRVEAGAVLVEMASAEVQALLQEARATVQEAARQYERVQSLADQGTASKSLLDQQKRDLETARARLSALESRLAEDLIIKAPFAGVLGLRNISVGALVEPGDLITTLDDDSVLKLDFPVPTTFLQAARPGLAIVARSAAYGEREFRGEVRSIDSRVDPVTRSVQVRALVPNPERLLKPGMLMQVDLLQNPRQGLTVPEEALLSLGQTHAVFVVAGDRPVVRRREVDTGVRWRGRVEVLDGLAAGEQVVTHGTTRVKDGETVTVKAVDDGSRSLEQMLGSGAPAGPAP